MPYQVSRLSPPTEALALPCERLLGRCQGKPLHIWGGSREGGNYPAASEHQPSTRLTRHACDQEELATRAIEARFRYGVYGSLADK